MNRSLSRAISLVAMSLAALQFAPAASAATAWDGSWNYTSCGAPASAPAASTLAWGNSYTCTDTVSPANATMNISGWSSQLNPSANFAAAAVYPWGSTAGFGVVSKEECGNTANVCDPGTGPHATDNLGNLDGFLLKFADTPSSTVSVALNSIKVGWNGTDSPSVNCSTNCTYDDSDISVYYYTGTDTTNAALTGISAANLQTLNTNPTGTVNGWKLLSNISNVGSFTNNTATFNNSGTTVSASWWLITASNSTTGTTSSTDAFKLLSVAGKGTTTTPPPGGRTPEPASLALAGAALLGVLATRRKST